MSDSTSLARDPRYAPAGEPGVLERAGGLKVGDRVRFNSEGQARFKVRARGDRFLILTKAFNLHPRAKCLYTVISLDQGIRGTHDSYGHGCEGEEEIARTLAALESGEIEMSVRNNVTLAIADVKEAPTHV